MPHIRPPAASDRLFCFQPPAQHGHAIGAAGNSEQDVHVAPFLRRPSGQECFDEFILMSRHVSEAQYGHNEWEGTLTVMRSRQLCLSKPPLMARRQRGQIML